MNDDIDDVGDYLSIEQILIEESLKAELLKDQPADEMTGESQDVSQDESQDVIDGAAQDDAQDDAQDARPDASNDAEKGAKKSAVKTAGIGAKRVAKRGAENDTAQDSAAGVSKPRVKKWHLYVLLAISIAGVICFGVLLGIELYTTFAGQKYYSDMSTDVGKSDKDIGRFDLTNLPSRSPDTSGNAAGDDTTPDNSGSSGLDGVTAARPEWKPYVDFNVLSKKFEGITGWILLPGTPIDYPVVQHNDNAFYLNHLPDGSKHRAGSIFLDYRNKADFSDKNVLIYGHMSRSGEMFGGLKKYRDQAYYKENPVMYLFTPDKDYAIVLIAGYLLDSGVEVPPMSFKDDDAFLAHIKNIKRRSLFKSDVVVEADDRIVSMCTCAYDYTNARWILVGILVEIGSAQHNNDPVPTYMK